MEFRDPTLRAAPPEAVRTDPTPLRPAQSLDAPAVPTCRAQFPDPARPRAVERLATPLRGLGLPERHRRLEQDPGEGTQLARLPVPHPPAGARDGGRLCAPILPGDLPQTLPRPHPQGIQRRPLRPPRAAGARHRQLGQRKERHRQAGPGGGSVHRRDAPGSGPGGQARRGSGRPALLAQPGRRGPGAGGAHRAPAQGRAAAALLPPAGHPLPLSPANRPGPLLSGGGRGARRLCHDHPQRLPDRLGRRAGQLPAQGDGRSPPHLYPPPGGGPLGLRPSRPDEHRQGAAGHPGRHGQHHPRRDRLRPTRLPAHRHHRPARAARPHHLPALRGAGPGA